MTYVVRPHLQRRMGPLTWRLDLAEIEHEVIRICGHIVMHCSRELAIPADELKGTFQLISGGEVAGITDDMGTPYRPFTALYAMRTPTRRPGEGWVGDELTVDFQSRWKPTPPVDARVLSIHFEPIIEVRDSPEEPARQFSLADPVYEMPLPAAGT